MGSGVSDTVMRKRNFFIYLRVSFVFLIISPGEAPEVPVRVTGTHDAGHTNCPILRRLSLKLGKRFRLCLCAIFLGVAAQRHKATVCGAIAYRQHRIPRQRICQLTGILCPVTQTNQPVARKRFYGQHRLLNV